MIFLAPQGKNLLGAGAAQASKSKDRRYEPENRRVFTRSPWLDGLRRWQGAAQALMLKLNLHQHTSRRACASSASSRCATRREALSCTFHAPAPSAHSRPHARSTRAGGLKVVAITVACQPRVEGPPRSSGVPCHVAGHVAHPSHSLPHPTPHLTSPRRDDDGRRCFSLLPSPSHAFSRLLSPSHAFPRHPER